ncbi:hypothetical protein D3C72_1890950 [compost metagenome]
MASDANFSEFRMGSGAPCSARCMLARDHCPHCMTGPLVLVKAAMKTTMSGSMEIRITRPTPLV